MAPTKFNEWLDPAFRWSTIRKHWGLMPTIFFTALPLAMCGAYVTYMCLTKPDLSWRPWSWGYDAPYQQVGPTECTKMYDNLRGRVVPDEKLVKLRREIYDYYVIQGKGGE